jgi:hypothetical protein
MSDVRHPDNSFEQEGETYVFWTPDARFAHSADQVGSRKQHDMDISMLPVLCMDSPEHSIDFVIEVIQNDSGSLVGLESLPWVNHQPCRRFFCGKVAHVHAVGRAIRTNKFGGRRGDHVESTELSFQIRKSGTRTAYRKLNSNPEARTVRSMQTHTMRGLLTIRL